MNVTVKNIPKLRFKEFSGEWIENTLDCLCDEFKSGKNITAKDIFNKGSYPVYGGNGLRGYSEQFTHDDSLVLIGRQGGLCGNINRVYGKAYISEHAIVIKENKNSDISWLFYRLDFLNLNNYSESSAQPGLSVNKIKKITIFSPSKQEQQKIADFLSSVDSKIQVLKQQQQLLQQYKKGMMQKLFSQQIRFKDDNGHDYPDWEFILAKKLFYNYSNKKHNSDLPILAVTQDKGVVNRDDIDKHISSSNKSIASYKVVNKGDFIISLRSFQGGIEYSYITGICSPAYTILKADKSIIDDFYRYYFKKESFISQLSMTVVGIRDGKQISYDAFSSIKLPYPSLPEQQKIADCLSAIDKKIELVSKKITYTQQFKQGLLQQLFV
ncbi:restriction endonuclease subunit S [Orbus wheelerorum]|uniref:restriction endonuclease subunit S n=1 Tax=Orbus wheelerorum TaxID=3074111 RepID=UPI00370DCE4C